MSETTYETHGGPVEKNDKVYVTISDTAPIGYDDSGVGFTVECDEDTEALRLAADGLIKTWTEPTWMNEQTPPDETVHVTISTTRPIGFAPGSGGGGVGSIVECDENTEALRLAADRLIKEWMRL